MAWKRIFKEQQAENDGLRGSLYEGDEARTLLHHLHRNFVSGARRRNLQNQYFLDDTFYDEREFIPENLPIGGRFPRGSGDARPYEEDCGGEDEDEDEEGGEDRDNGYNGDEDGDEDGDENGDGDGRDESKSM